MKRSGLASVAVLTAFYWLSDLVVGLWIGGLITAYAVLTLPIDFLPEGASPEAVAAAAETAVGMVDKLRPFAIAAAIILVASVVLSVVLERQARHSVGWWVIWFVRSATCVAMVAVAFYSLGEIDANITDLERNIASLRSPVSALAAPDSSALPAAGQGAPDVTVPGSRAFGGATAETVLARFHSLYETYKKWMWVEFSLGAFILLAGAIKQAAWRHSWVTQRESRRLGLEPEKDERAKASDGS